MKIEPEPLELLDNTLTKKKVPAKINKKPPTRIGGGFETLEDSKVHAPPQRRRGYDEEEEYEPNNALGPAKAWDKVKDQFLPYNIRNYQDRLVMFLKRV